LNESKGITRATNANQFYQKCAFIVQMDRIKIIKASAAGFIWLSHIIFNILKEDEWALTLPLGSCDKLPVYRSACTFSGASRAD
jgi:hypothetical protein